MNGRRKGTRGWQRVSNPGGDYAFQVPSYWVIRRYPDHPHIVQANDPRHGASLTAVGYRSPPGGSLEDFARIRFAPENREAFLEALGEPAAFEGGYWLETEGTWPGETAPTRYIIAVSEPPEHKGYLSFSLVTTPHDLERHREQYLEILQTAHFT